MFYTELLQILKKDNNKHHSYKENNGALLMLQLFQSTTR